MLGLVWSLGKEEQFGSCGATQCTHGAPRVIGVRWCAEPYRDSREPGRPIHAGEEAAVVANQELAKLTTGGGHGGYGIVGGRIGVARIVRAQLLR